VPLDRSFAAAARDLGRAFAELADEGFHALTAGRKELGVPLELRRQDRHARSVAVRSDRTVQPSSRDVREGEWESVHVRLSDPSLADAFVAFLRRSDCVVEPGEVAPHEGGIAVAVRVPQAYNQEQARLEVALYLRVWEALHPGSGAQVLD
jgi:hypothetical protein